MSNMCLLLCTIVEFDRVCLEELVFPAYLPSFYSFSLN